MIIRSFPFGRICDALGIEHRLTKINHPWTKDQAEHPNRTIKEATVKRYYSMCNDRVFYSSWLSLMKK